MKEVLLKVWQWPALALGELDLPLSAKGKIVFRILGLIGSLSKAIFLICSILGIEFTIVGHPPVLALWFVGISAFVYAAGYFVFYFLALLLATASLTD